MKRFILCGTALAVCAFLFFQVPTIIVSGDETNSSKSEQTESDQIVRFMWWTDTQYAEEFPYEGKTIFLPLSADRYRLLSERLYDDYKKGNVSYGIFTGDFVWDADSRIGLYPWAVCGWPNVEVCFAPAMRDSVPFGVLAGNHDYVKGSEYWPYTKYFGKEKFKNKKCYGESFKNNVGHYDLISAGGADFIIVYMSYGVDNSTARNYVDSVLKRHKERKAIICTHDDPDWVYSVARDNSNVFMTLYGHYYNQNGKKTAEFVESRSDGTHWHRCYHNYQTAPDYAGQPGYFRMIEMNITQNILKLWTEDVKYPRKNKIEQTTKTLFY